MRLTKNGNGTRWLSPRRTFGSGTHGENKKDKIKRDWRINKETGGALPSLDEPRDTGLFPRYDHREKTGEGQQAKKQRRCGRMR